METKQCLVVKDNALINASYRLNLTEQLLILMSTVKARDSGKGITTDQPLIVRAEDYANQFKVTRQAAYIALKEATTGLFERYFTFEQITKKGNIEVIKSRWVSQISYIENEGAVSITFAPAVVQLITCLEKRFTSYDLEQVSNLKSTYAVRLYELLIAWRSTGKTPKISLKEFRERLGVGSDEYVRMHHFKAKVLDFAIKQINEHTNITAKYEQHKKGRSISGFSFTFKMKKSAQVVELPAKPKRKQITTREAEQMAWPGESYPQLLNRLKGEYWITDLKKKPEDSDDD